MKTHAQRKRIAILALFTGFLISGLPHAWSMPGYAMMFNGTNNYVWVERPVADDFTIEFWMNSTQVAGTNTQWWQGMGLVDGEVYGAYGDFGVSLGAGTVVFGTGGAGDVSIRSGVVADGNWHHVAASRVRTNGLMSLYVDGTLQASVQGTTARLDASRQVRFGSLASGLNFFRGQLDEVKIWSSARTALEIQSDMRATPDTSEPNLAGYWPFCEGPTTIQTADASGHWLHGHLVNRPFWIPSPVGWTPALELNGANPTTNECHTAFVDAGADLVEPPAAISAGVLHNLVLRADGTLVTWGNPMVNGLDVPSGPDLRFASIAAGAFFNQGLKVDGTVEGAGGDGGSSMAHAVNSSTGIVAIAAGIYHTLALKSDGRINAAGYSYYGAIAVPASATNVVVISAYDSLNLVLRTDGTVVGWGQSPYSHTPPVDASNLVSLAAGGHQGMALRADGAVVVWGDNTYGQLNIPASATRVVAVAAGNNHCVALRDDGRVVAWGDNTQGQSSVPPAATNIIMIKACYDHNLALRADGRIITWGSAADGLPNIPPGVGRRLLAGSGVVDTNSPGTYQRTHIYTNVDRRVLAANRLVVVADSTQPRLSLRDSNSMVVRVGTDWAEPGATALDACAGELTGGIVITGRVDAGVCGRYTLGYSVTDPGGNTALTNRVVIVGDVPGLSGISSPTVATNPVTGGRRVQLGIDINPNGLPTSVCFQYGLTGGYEGVSQALLDAGFAWSNQACVVEGLMQGTIYHWRVVASNSLGVTSSPDQILEVPALYALGDRNGDGVVDAAEFSAVLARLHGNGVVSQADLGLVLSNYWPGSGWLQMTNVAGLGGRNVTFALTNDLSGAFSVESSTDLLNWSLLGPAVPRYEYSDTNAPAGPQRYYRLRWP